VFEFDPGDLGKKKFVAHRLQVGADGSLTMAYTDTPIRELAGVRSGTRKYVNDGCQRCGAETFRNRVAGLSLAA